MPRDRVVLPTPEFSIPAAVFTPVGLVMVIPVDPAGKTVTFGISEALAEPKSRAGWTEYERSGEAARAAKRNYAGEDTQPVRSLIDGTDDAAVRLWAPYSIPDLPTWHRGRVCLIGDAAHALPPNGQGSAQALEDAGVLARLLASEQAVAQGHDRLFAHFERVRRARVETVKKFSKAAGAAKGRSGPWVWWAKKWAMWVYMSWWNGGVFRDTRLMGYDVDEEDILVK
jgi:2-polyprenyl-6-methoxyphenol hydroxylase-like FAD-dependent oxidoreductase